MTAAPAVFLCLLAAMPPFLMGANMATNYVQDGTTLDWYNGTGESVLSGEAAAVGTIIGVAHDHIPPETVGVMHMTGVFALAKAAEAVTAGQKLYFDSGIVTATAGDPAVLAGTAWADADAADESVPVRLGY